MNLTSLQRKLTKTKGEIKKLALSGFTENSHLKTVLAEVLLESKNTLASEDCLTRENQITAILSENTGCAEDIELLESLFTHILSLQQINTILKISPSNR